LKLRHHTFKNYDLTNNDGDSMEMSLGQIVTKWIVDPKFWPSNNIGEMMVEC
jgi:hypothetical protein